MDRRRLLQLAGAFLASGAAPGALFAQKAPITMVVPFPPGGGGDILARTVSLLFSEALDEKVVILNRPGAGRQHRHGPSREGPSRRRHDRLRHERHHVRQCPPLRSAVL